MRKASLIDFAGNPVQIPTPEEKIRYIPPVLTEYPDLQSWREARNPTIGGSEAAAVLGVHPYLSALELYNLKAGLIEPSDEESEILEWGRRLEAPIVDAYMEKTGRRVTRYGIHIFRHPAYPISVSIDGEILAFDERGLGVLECKTTSAYSEKDLQGELPIEWQIQMQHEMGVMGMKWASIAVLILPARKLRYQDIERNDEFIELLFRKELEFLKRIEDNDPPPADGSESASTAINKLFPRDSGETVALPAEASLWAGTLEGTKEEIKRLETIRDENANKLKAAIGNATFGRLQDGGTYSWKLQHRNSYIVRETEFRVLRKIK